MWIDWGFGDSRKELHVDWVDVWRCELRIGWIWRFEEGIKCGSSGCLEM